MRNIVSMTTRYIVCLIFSCGWGNLSWAQESHKLSVWPDYFLVSDTTIGLEVVHTKEMEIPQRIPAGIRTLAVSGNIFLEDEHAGYVALRFWVSGKKWTPWQKIDRFHERLGDTARWVSELIFLPQYYTRVQGRIVQTSETYVLTPDDVFSLKWDYYETEPIESLSSQSGFREVDCFCPQPVYIDRAGWGNPTGNEISCPDPTYVPVTHLIVHHSAGVSESDNWPAVVRAIRNFHVNTNGWCDMGYNWLIDPNGVIYEGRGGGNDIRGAHFCGANSATMGVCLLGNFEENEPTEAALNSLDSLLTWKACDRRLNPAVEDFHVSSGKNLQVISGHKDGCGTLCPGVNLYSQLDSTRKHVTRQLDACTAVTHIDTELNNVRVRIFPNPSNGQLRLGLQGFSGEEFDAVLTDLKGRVVAKKRGYLKAPDQELAWNLGSLNPGIYVCQVQMGKRKWNEKLILLK